MKLTIQREALLKPLVAMMGVVEKRQTLPILSNVLITVQAHSLSLLATDLEVELIAKLQLEAVEEGGEVTVSARKLMDICRTLPEHAEIHLIQEPQRLLLHSGRSRFTLATLPAADFPNIEEVTATSEFTLLQSELRYLIEHCYFAMAQQDVRYYLNGMLLEVNNQQLRAVATDGHRLALATISANTEHAGANVIIPRKGVLELLRLLNEPLESVKVTLGTQHLRVESAGFIFTSKLIDGRYPDYHKVIPKNSTKHIEVDKDELKQALTRVAILSSDKFRGVCMQLSLGLLRIQANNPEQEEAEEQLEIDYAGEALDIGFNVSYVQDVLAALPAGKVKFSLADADSSILIASTQTDQCLYVVMPMRL